MASAAIGVHFARRPGLDRCHFPRQPLLVCLTQMLIPRKKESKAHKGSLTGWSVFHSYSEQSARAPPPSPGGQALIALRSRHRPTMRIAGSRICRASRHPTQFWC